MTEVIHFSLLYPYRLCLPNPNQGGSQGTQPQQKRGEREEEDTSQVSSVCLWVLMSLAERIWRRFPAGQQSALNGPAVHSGVPVPAEQLGSAKKGQTEPHYIAHSDNACFYEGFHSEVTNRLQDNWGEHML